MPKIWIILKILLYWAVQNVTELSTLGQIFPVIEFIFEQLIIWTNLDANVPFVRSLLNANVISNAIYDKNMEGNFDAIDANHVDLALILNLPLLNT